MAVAGGCLQSSACGGSISALPVPRGQIWNAPTQCTLRIARTIVVVFDPLSVSAALVCVLALAYRGSSGDFEDSLGDDYFEIRIAGFCSVQTGVVARNLDFFWVGCFDSTLGYTVDALGRWVANLILPLFQCGWSLSLRPGLQFSHPVVRLRPHLAPLLSVLGVRRCLKRSRGALLCP
ncbi:unnamed protein product [Bursaphelenchus xylophilus]|uniref:(pine wood nematode) hypothetical protein n=1 Tax=Bursaphelenchus xylophilus TaxID=6326 RepID=A0A1I7SC55_BURXY|nr:unnamed protein product [Bursaphelenchus xylophilus]CAG9094704.1 unnamed protein product [Bursaphelenchus xylophilus]